VLTTKVFHSTTGTPGDVGLAPDRIRRQLEASFTRLGVDRVDLYLAHEPDAAIPVADTIDTFERLRDEGLIGAWGLSNYDAGGLREALESDRPAVVQNSFSLLDRGDRELLPLCEELGIAYVPFGPLAGGWLTGKYRRGEPFPERSRMSQRPASYERYHDDRVFEGSTACVRRRSEGESTCRHSLSPGCSPASTARFAARCAPSTSSRFSPHVSSSFHGTRFNGSEDSLTTPQQRR
jgi:aryl-alcohol dehydrogenase-like predicted oxidoreductase